MFDLIWSYIVVVIIIIILLWCYRGNIYEHKVENIEKEKDWKRENSYRVIESSENNGHLYVEYDFG